MSRAGKTTWHILGVQSKAAANEQLTCRSSCVPCNIQMLKFKLEGKAGRVMAGHIAGGCVDGCPYGDAPDVSVAEHRGKMRTLGRALWKDTRLRAMKLLQSELSESRNYNGDYRSGALFSDIGVRCGCMCSQFKVHRAHAAMPGQHRMVSGKAGTPERKCMAQDASNIAQAPGKTRYVDSPPAAVPASRAMEATLKPLEPASTAWALANLVAKGSL
ncbi:unnamed protein product, partial [Symbiodinium sp. KB8]